MIYGTIGIHPHETTNNKMNLDYIMNNLDKNPKIIGIGETGLDFFYNNSDKNNQINSFKEHINASIKRVLFFLERSISAMVSVAFMDRGFSHKTAF